MKSIRTLFIALVLLPGLCSSAQNIRGKVIDDWGKPVAGVCVSDGVSVVRTAEDGTYAIDSDKSQGFVFISVPSGYKVKMREDGTPAFWQALKESATVCETADFKIIGQEQESYTVQFNGKTPLFDLYETNPAPAYYSLNIAGDHWIVMDNVITVSKAVEDRTMFGGVRYEKSTKAGFSDVQKAWLLKDLETVAEGQTVRLFTTSPLSGERPAGVDYAYSPQSFRPKDDIDGSVVGTFDKSGERFSYLSAGGEEKWMNFYDLNEVRRFYQKDSLCLARLASQKKLTDYRSNIFKDCILAEIWLAGPDDVVRMWEGNKEHEVEKLVLTDPLLFVENSFFGIRCKKSKTTVYIEVYNKDGKILRQEKFYRPMPFSRKAE